MSFAWWLSFSAESGNLGACVVETMEPDIVEAAIAARHQGCNPGGQIAGWYYPAEEYEKGIPRELWWKLRSAAEWDAVGVRIGRPPSAVFEKHRCAICNREHGDDPTAH